MSYFLKKSVPNYTGRVYLQIYESFYTPGKGGNNKCYMKLGYIDNLINSGIADPIKHFSDVVKKMNDELKTKKSLQISDRSSSMFLGHFLVKSMFDTLDMDKHLEIVASTKRWQYQFSDMFKTLCYSQILSPGSKYQAFENVIPNIYGANCYSYDQILDAVEFIGSDYHKYIEMLNHFIAEQWTRNLNKVYFDCTNYYFEIDLENDYLRKGPGKDGKRAPLLGQALMLDAEQIPIDTEFYPGSESEFPYLRKRVEDMKARNNVAGKVIQVADKGLNCARNIYSAVIEANDGYIFSKSLREKKISADFRNWIFVSDNDLNKWVDVRNSKGELLYMYKTAKSILKSGKVVEYGKFEYKCKINPEDAKEETFVVKEKRIITYNPTLAIKQKAEIQKEAEKALKYSGREALRDELGNPSKYINLISLDENGKKQKVLLEFNQEKYKEDMKLAGYNMLITSEINADPKEIYKTYHQLWRIEESFRVLKTHLESRPAYVSKRETIYGHFLICYVSLVLMRLLEIKIFDDEIPVSQLFEFIRQYKVTKVDNGSFVNNSTESSTYRKIKEKLGLSKLGCLYLSKKDITDLLKTEFDI